MIAVIQRVSEASVTIDNNLYSKISKGFLILLGVKSGDNEEQAKYLSKKIADLRIFSDEQGKMNLSVKAIQGEILVISQFTLCTDNGKSGNRPSFVLAEKPERANELYELMVTELKILLGEEKIKTGVFAADMKVGLVNDGPVTIILER
ncbi:MAG: D-tyrosyl-tRNA(Tyr) deacylase [Ignavibacteria bacterium]|nr:D-tyrosyl-tRNA(Tyr) deacylase [Ignavibacteria bacterium]